jgi:putative spermidine/putrescine transport system ATP-binding protein
VRDSIYLGDHFRHLLELQSHGNWIIKTMSDNGGHPLSSGSLVDIAWNEQDCIALDSQK